MLSPFLKDALVNSLCQQLMADKTSYTAYTTERDGVEWFHAKCDDGMMYHLAVVDGSVVFKAEGLK